ncbi:MULTISPECIES: hypothetical protein [Reichenbachiella]|uniref:Uncharacterized protein n=1 Tax=Reichenbachiella agariperforans TaxID=156994 RepID=A0A1M6NRK2_REIAG|nr:MULTISPECIES: hypothetical protein [Reichenbachiella]MBU2916006.1 hypothetical protein [Reichenbachiella agariperforans]RJE71752.1 hypothetical protein BGP76_06600 [Reichenbachiella sp. MSK19-1]SHJ98334.1 hypothetical protein SAMN04488028_102375 [Reichenbachiella agariperforans]
MKTEYIWYNPAEKEYQFGDRQTYLAIIKNSNQSQNFVILDSFDGITAAFRQKLISRLRFLNSLRRSDIFEFI